MKRIVTLVVALMLLMAMAVPALADPGEFVQSPSLRQPRLISGRTNDPAWDKELIVTAYGDRHTLEENHLADFENAYWAIANATDLGNLIPGLEAYTDVTTAQLAASDLFHVHERTKQVRATRTGNNGELVYTLTVECNTMNSFKALVRYSADGWDIVENAAEKNGQVTFDTTELGAFAVVVNYDGNSDTGENFPVALFAGLMIVAAAGIVILLVTNRKKA